MPNLSPTNVRAKYTYMTVRYVLVTAAECRRCIENRIIKTGFSVDMSRGDNINWRRI